MSAPPRSVFVDAASLPWRESPHAGVAWKKLSFDPDRGRSTVLLRFDPGASYGTHRHPAGERYWVLEGSLEERGETWGPGTYVEHPPGSVHTPRSAEGCLLLVLLDEPIEALEG